MTCLSNLSLLISKKYEAIGTTAAIFVEVKVEILQLILKASARSVGCSIYCWQCTDRRWWRWWLPDLFPSPSESWLFLPSWQQSFLEDPICYWNQHQQVKDSEDLEMWDCMMREISNEILRILLRLIISLRSFITLFYSCCRYKVDHLQVTALSEGGCCLHSSKI